MVEGQEFERKGADAEANRIATELVRAIRAARSMRRDGTDSIRESDVDALAWAQSVIERHRTLELVGALPSGEARVLARSPIVSTTGI